MRATVRPKANSDGWRGVLAEDFTVDFVRSVAGTLGSTASRGIFVIGFDTRFMGEYLANEAAGIIASYGHTCIVSQCPVPTPVVTWATLAKKAQWGVQITASHNPSFYNGIKLRKSCGTPPTPEEMSEIDTSLAPAKGGQTGVIKTNNYLSEYCEKIASQFDLEKIANSFPKIVVDSMHGTTGGILRKILAGVIDVAEVREQADPLFGGQAPEPKSDTTLTLKEALTSHGCNIGFAHDGDGDRIVAWDADYGFVSPQDLLAVLAWHSVRQNIPGSFITSATTTSRVKKIARRFSRDFHQVDVGFYNASKMMLKSCVCLAGEENGGIAFGRHIPDRDGTFAALVVLDLLAEHKASIGEILAEIEKEYGRTVYIRKDISLKLAMTEDPGEFLIKTLSLDASAITEIKNGAKAKISDDSWVVVRKAGTEPLLRIYTEAPDEKVAEAIISSVTAGIEGNGVI